MKLIKEKIQTLTNAINSLTLTIKSKLLVIKESDEHDDKEKTYSLYKSIANDMIERRAYQETLDSLSFNVDESDFDGRRDDDFLQTIKDNYPVPPVIDFSFTSVEDEDKLFHVSYKEIDSLLAERLRVLLELLKTSGPEMTISQSNDLVESLTYQRQVIDHLYVAYKKIFKKDGNINA